MNTDKSHILSKQYNESLIKSKNFTIFAYLFIIKKKKHEKNTTMSELVTSFWDYQRPSAKNTIY
jgi:hypothetical protein